MTDFTAAKTANDCSARAARPHFETLLLELSSNLVNAAANHFDRVMGQALTGIINYLGIDRANLFETQGKDLLVAQHLQAADGVEVLPVREFSPADFPFLYARLSRGEHVAWRDHQQLPPAAASDVASLRSFGNRSGLVIPLLLDEEMQAFLHFSTIRVEREWPQAEVRGLTILGKILLSALQRRRLESEAAKTEQRYLNLLANTSEMLWCIEADEPFSIDLPEMEQVERLFRTRVVEANEAFANAYGSSLDAVIGKWRLEDFIPRSFPTTVPMLLEAVRSRYRMENLETIEQAVTGETKVLVNNFIGTIENGKVLRIWGMCRDATETRETEKQIRLRQEAIENSGDGFVIVDATLPDLPITYANRRFEELTGYAAAEILGRNCRFLQGTDTDSDTVTSIREALLAGTRFEGEILNYRKDGSTFWNLLRISPVRDNSGKLTHFVGLQTDVTERRLADLASRQQRDELAHVTRAATLVEIGAALAHELNQPLAAILRNAQAAQRFLDREAPDLPQVREILADIVKDDRRAGDVLGRIRQHLRKEESRHDRIDVNDVVQHTLALLRSELIIKHVDVKLQLAECLPLILGDAIQLQQVIMNLVLNAVEAMRTAQRNEGQVVIETSSPDQDTICVSVSDSGQGIDERDLERVFDPFHTTKEQGMGVGLSINRTIVKSHDGRMWAENVPDGGARFVFTIPAATSGADRDGS